MHRVLIISHTYIPPSNRGKLRALAARGLEVTVGVPQRWRNAVLGRTLEVGWERQNGVEVFPLPAGGAPGGAGGASAQAPRGALHPSERPPAPALARRLAPQPHVAPAARRDRRERGRGGARPEAGARAPGRRDPAARRP